MKNRNVILAIEVDKDDNSKVIHKYYEFKEDYKNPLKQVCEIIDTDTVSFVPIFHDIAIIVDENGLIKNNNHVIEFSISDTDYMYAGNLIFVSVENDKISSLSEYQLKYLVKELSYSPLIDKYTK